MRIKVYITLIFITAILFAVKEENSIKQFDRFNFSYGFIPIIADMKTYTNEGITNTARFFSFHNIFNFDFYIEDGRLRERHTEIVLDIIKTYDRNRGYLEFADSLAYTTVDITAQYFTEHKMNEPIAPDFYYEIGSGLSLNYRWFTNTNTATNYFYIFDFPYFPYTNVNPHLTLTNITSVVTNSTNLIRAIEPSVTLDTKFRIEIPIDKKETVFFNSYLGVGGAIGFGWLTGTGNFFMKGPSHRLWWNMKEEFLFSQKYVDFKIGISIGGDYKGYLIYTLNYMSQNTNSVAGGVFLDTEPIYFNAFVGVNFRFSLLIFE